MLVGGGRLESVKVILLEIFSYKAKKKKANLLKRKRLTVSVMVKKNKNQFPVKMPLDSEKVKRSSISQ